MKILNKILACFMIIAVMLSSVTVSSYAAPKTKANKNKTQISSAVEFVSYENLDLQIGKNKFMDDWKFNLGDLSGAENSSFDDSQWRHVDLPHDYSIEQGYNKLGEAESAFLPGGVAWYRKNFIVPADFENKNRVFIDFDGVYMSADVYLNGEKLGSHHYGYTNFSFDLTDKLNYGAENTLAVRVDNPVPTSRWYSGSGIYRNVYLDVKGSNYIDKDSVVISAKNIQENTRNLDVKLDLVKKTSEAKNYIVKTEIFDANEAFLGSAQKEILLDANKRVNIDLNLAIELGLWSLENPVMYKAVTTLIDKDTNKVVDKELNDFGLRYFNFDADRGFSLNGENIKLQGVSMHHDQGALGARAYESAIDRQLDILKGMGVNAIRTTHNPYSDDFIRLANEKGFIIVEEAFDPWTLNKNGNRNDYSTWFDTKVGSDNAIYGASADMTWAEFDIKQMVKRDRNYPAIVLWSTGNEVRTGVSGSSLSYPSIAGKLADWLKDVDTTRPATIGDNTRNEWGIGGRINQELLNRGGVIGFNYANEMQYDAVKGEFPLYASETSSAINSRGIYSTRNQSGFDLTSYDEKTVGWGTVSSHDWYKVITRDFVAGNFIWTGFDYLGEPTPWNGTGTNNKVFPQPKNSYFGIVDLAGLPKDRYYFYSSQWRKDITTLHLLPAWSPSIAGGKNNIVVYSNAPKVKLFFTKAGTNNRVLVGEQSMEKHVTDSGHVYQTVKGESGHKSLYYKFTKEYEAGKLEAEAYDENDQKIESTYGRSYVEDTKEAKSIRLSLNKTELKADGRDLAYLTVELLDEDGKLAESADDEVTVNVSGAAHFEAMDNGVQADMTPFTNNTRAARAGKLVAIVQADRENGEATIRVSGAGLASATAKINVSGASSNSEIKGFEYSKNYTVKLASTELDLPSTVKVVKADGTKEDKNVVWNTSDLAEKLAKEGSFKLSATVDGKYNISVNVTVVEQVVAVLNYSTYTRKGFVPNLPEQRAGVDKNGNVLSTYFNVKWNEADLAESNFENEGIVVVNGSSEVFGESILLKAKVRVTELSTIDAGDRTKDVEEFLVTEGPEFNLSDLTDEDANTGVDVSTNEMNFVYNTAFDLGKVEIEYTGEEPKVDLSWSLGAGAGFSKISAKKTVENNKLVFTFQKVPVVELKLRLTSENQNTKVSKVALRAVEEKVDLGSTAKLNKLIVNGSPVLSAKLNLDEIRVGEEAGEIIAEAADNAAITLVPQLDKKAYIITESEDNTVLRKQVIIFGAGDKFEVISTQEKGGIAFAYFTNRGGGSNDYIENINDGLAVPSVRWSDWQRGAGKLRENYIGIILPVVDTLNPTVNKLVFSTFKDRETQKPSQVEVQVYTGPKFNVNALQPFENLRDNDNLENNPFVNDANWKTVKTISGADLEDMDESSVDNIISLDEPVETRAIRLKMEQVLGKSLAATELSIYGKYMPKEPVLVSYNADSEDLPMAISSYTCGGDRIEHVNDGVISYTNSPKNRWTNWTRPAREGDWLGIILGQSRTPLLHRVSKLDLSIFIDSGCKLPKDLVVEYLDPSAGKPKLPSPSDAAAISSAYKILSNDANWKEVSNLHGLDTIKENAKATLTFDEVDTYAIRINMKGQEDPNAGSVSLTEFEVFGYALEEAAPNNEPDGNEAFRIFPSVREYNTSNGEFSKANLNRFFVVENEVANKTARINEVVDIVSREFASREVPSSETLAIIYNTIDKVEAGDIVVDLQANMPEFESADGFTIDVSDKIVVKAMTANGAMYGLRAVMQYLQVNSSMPYGKIIDYPEAKERALHLDMGRKYFTADWIKQTIRELSFDRLNAIQLHFSEHEGYRLESETYPQIMSDEYITKKEMREIIAEANRYGVEIIPSFDTPGHMKKILDNLGRDDFILKDKNGNLADAIWASGGALDINNPEARQFVKDIISEYADLFKGSRYFHIGGDEFINFNEFNKYPSLIEFGQKHVEDGVKANGLDGYTAYINEIAAHVKSLGMTPRIWNDGVYRRNFKANVTLDPDIEIAYWTKWDYNMAKTDTFLEKGHNLINVNDMMYYVLKEPGSGAYSTPPDPRKIYNDWNIGKFNAGQTYDYNDPQYKDRITAGMYAIWCDHPQQQTEEEVTEGIFYSLRAMAEKSWSGDREGAKYSRFKNLLNNIGELRDISGIAAKEISKADDLVEVRFISKRAENGYKLGIDGERRGRIGEEYVFEAPEFNGYSLVDNTNLEIRGTFTADEVIEIEYKQVVDKTRLEEALANELNEADYIADTFVEYKTALLEAKAVRDDDEATLIDVANAVSELEAAKGSVVKMGFEPLYTRLLTKKDRNLYTAATYAPYEREVDALRVLIKGTDADVNNLGEYTKRLDEAEAGLVELGDAVEIEFSVTNPSKSSYYLDHSVDKMFDGNNLTFFWTDYEIPAGMEFNFDLTSLVELKGFDLRYPLVLGEDYIRKAKLQASVDGQWVDLGDIDGSNNQELSFDKVKTDKIRILFTEDIPKWMKIAEVRLDYKKVDDEEIIVDKTDLVSAIESAEKVKTEVKYILADEENKAKLDEALEIAMQVNADDSATEAQVNEAKENLLNAIDSLNGEDLAPVIVFDDEKFEADTVFVNTQSPVFKGKVIANTLKELWIADEKVEIEKVEDGFVFEHIPLFVSDGSYKLDIRAVNDSGDTVTKTISLNIDTEAPRIEVDVFKDRDIVKVLLSSRTKYLILGRLIDNTEGVKLYVVDADGNRISDDYIINNDYNKNYAKFFRPFSYNVPLGDGRTVIKLVAEDLAGNKSEYKLSFEK